MSIVQDNNQAELDRRSDRYCIIGAGPAGLGVGRRFTDHGIAFDIVERHTDVGGIWDIDNPGGPMYESAHFISSKRLSAYGDFPFRDEAAEYPSHREVLEYVRAYADRFDLRRHCEFDRSVSRVEPEGDGWIVRLEGCAPRRYRGVVLATGYQWVPNAPRWPGADAFEGESLHSIAYRSASLFEGKRVLIVGCGASAVDIANDAAHRATRTFMSMRRGHHFVPKYLFGQPTDEWAKSGKLRLPVRLRQHLLERMLELLLGDPARFGLPKPEYRIFERPPILDGRIFDHLGHGRIRPKPDIAQVDAQGVTFTDGSYEPVDVIVYCTGYEERWPIIDERLLRPTGSDDLELHLWHRDFDNLFVAGLLRINAGGFWLFEEQADLMARSIKCSERQRDKLRAVVAATSRKSLGSVRYQKNHYQSRYLDAETYLGRLREVKRAMRWS